MESAVKVAKTPIDKNEDILDALLEYRSTPLANGYSPAELLMGRKLENCLRICPTKLVTPMSRNVIKKESEMKAKQVSNYNKRHRQVELKQLINGQTVWITDLKKYGVIQKPCEEYPRCYLITCDNKTYRRNRISLIPSSKVINIEKNCSRGGNQSDLNLEYLTTSRTQNGNQHREIPVDLENEDEVLNNDNNDDVNNEEESIDSDSTDEAGNSLETGNVDIEPLSNCNNSNLNNDVNSRLDEDLINPNNSSLIEGRPIREKRKPNWFGF